MKYVIEKLTELLNRLDNAYDKFVVNGKVNDSSLAAVENRSKAKELNEAIKILHAQNESRAINENEQAKEICKNCKQPLFESINSGLLCGNPQCREFYGFLQID